MFKYISLFLLIFYLGSSSAQSFIGKLNSTPSIKPQKISSEDTLRILAVMVNFQEDRDASTFGSGKFGTIYTKDYGNTILDPLPHDKAYFESHLDFIKNYFQKVSNGNLNIQYHVLPDTFSVSQTMRNYTPGNNSDDFTPLAEFSKEVWEIADSKYPGFNFNDYDIFTIFHAGVGRDISLPGSLGNERDLPSVYLGLKTLKNIYGESFNGFQLSGGFNITNSMIIPETESRELSSLGGDVLFEISINGLLAASVASHLGLPDLFDTETGLSAIGRFGLMDGQSIFAYNGVFPPEPSAWEKIYLGWAEPVTLAGEDKDISLVNHLIASSSDTVILKIPVNSSEYFLVENRMRDVQGDGSKLTYVLNGDTLTKTFFKDTTGFYSFAVDSVDGVVIDVDEFDWAIPGNGIVIWHIDENVIEAKLADNKINTDKNNRGVDVEEADGVQDIGERFFNIFGDEVIAEGTADDFWFAGNGSKLYKNRFSKDTRPNTNSNSGANSLITIKDFSEISPRMNFTVTFGDSIVKPLLMHNLGAGNNIEFLSHISDLKFSTLVDSSLLLVDGHSTTAVNGTFSNYKPAVLNKNGNRFIFGVSANQLNIINSSDPQNIITINLPAGESATAAPLVRMNEQGFEEVLIGTSRGRVLVYSLQNFPAQNPEMFGTFTTDSSGAVLNLAAGSDYAAFTTLNGLFDTNGLQLYFNSSGMTDVLDNIIDLAVTKNKNGKDIPIIITNNTIYVVNGSTSFSRINLRGSNAEAFAIADVKNDGENYILFANGNEIIAVNLEGALAENFSFNDPEEKGFTGTPLAADFEGDAKAEVIAYTKDGRIFSIDGGTGKVVNGFPLSAGAELAAAPVLFNYQGKTALGAVDVKNNLYVWSIGSDEGTLLWAEENSANNNSSFAAGAANSNVINEFFPVNRVYNYPNPVYGNETAIRYYISEDSKINIKIFDLAGDFVAELNADARGGFDNETIWNVSEIQSGVYIARIEAASSAGKTENSIIKIAVIK